MAKCPDLPTRLIPGKSSDLDIKPKTIFDGTKLRLEPSLPETTTYGRKVSIFGDLQLRKLAPLILKGVEYAYPI